MSPYAYQKIHKPAFDHLLKKEADLTIRLITDFYYLIGGT